jgi:hypothetical protein
VSVYVHEPVNVLDVDVVGVLLLLYPQKINYIVQQIFQIPVPLLVDLPSSLMI